MEIDGIINQDLINEQVAKTRQSNSEVGEFDPNLFLKILMTQLQNQSPFDTADTSEILDQQAVLTQVEQSTRQTESLQQLQESVDIGLSFIASTLAEINSTLQAFASEENIGGGEEGGEQNTGEGGEETEGV